MEHPTKRDAFLEAKQLVSPHEYEQKKTRKVILENAAAIISVLVAGLSLVLYAYNGGYCKVFNLPVEVLPLEIDQYLPVAVQLVGVSVYILYYVSLVKTERLLDKRRFSFLRIMYGYLIISNIFTANHFDDLIGKWWSIAVYLGIPILFELLFYRMKMPTKNEEVSDTEKKILTEDYVFNRIFYSYYVQCGIFIVAIALIFAPLIGKTSAKANLNYQLCEIDNQLYAVIVDYDSTVLVQKAKEINDKLVINNESYEYVQKEDLEFVYCEYEKVIIQKGWSVGETTKEADNTKENAKKRIAALRWEEITVSPDWVMVIITAIYVVATCAICWANIKSAKATRDQVAESIRQFSENNRPYITCEYILKQRSYCGISVRNTGNQVARNLSIHINSAFLDSLKPNGFDSFQKLNESLYTLVGIGQSYEFYFSEVKHKPINAPLIVEVKYENNGIYYEDSFLIDLAKQLPIEAVETDFEKYMKLTKEQNSILTDIAQNIDKE